MEIPLCCCRREHILNVDIHRRENTGQLINQGNVDVTLNVFDDLSGFGYFQFPYVTNIFAGQLAVQLHQCFPHLWVGATDDPSDRTDPVSGITRIETLGTVGDFHILAHRHAQFIDERQPCLGGDPRVNGGLQYHDGVCTLWYGFKHSAPCCLNIGQVGFQVVCDGCGDGHQHDVAMRNGFSG